MKLPIMSIEYAQPVHGLQILRRMEARVAFLVLRAHRTAPTQELYRLVARPGDACQVLPYLAGIQQYRRIVIAERDFAAGVPGYDLSSCGEWLVDSR